MMGHAEPSLPASGGLATRIPRSLLIVLGWALALRIAHLVSFFSSSPFADTLISDAHIFDSWAARIAAGDVLGEPRLFVLPPLYPYVVGFVYAIVGRMPSVIILVQSTLGIIATGLVWRLGTRRFGVIVGVSAGFIYASSGAVLFYESMLVGTAVTGFLTVLALTLLDAWSDKRQDWLVGLLGVTLGLLVILRPNFLVLTPVLMWGVFRVRGRGRGFRDSLLTLACICLPLLALTVRNGVAAGEWTPLSSHGGINFYMGNHSGAPGWFAPPPGMIADITPEQPRGNLIGPRVIAEAEAGRPLSDREVSRFWFKKGLRYFLEEPVSATAGLFRKTRLFLTAFEIPLNYSFEYHKKYALALTLPIGQLWFIYPLAALGLAIAVRRGDSVADLVLILGAYAFSVILFHVSTRYRMPIMPILALLSGIALGSVVEAIKQGEGKRGLMMIAAAVLLMIASSVERSVWAKDGSLSLDPFNLGTSHLYAGRPDLALPYLKEAREAGDAVQGLQYNLGLAFAAADEVDSALVSYGLAIQRDPKLFAAHTNIGNIHFQAGRYREAESAYRDAIAVNALAHNARAALGWVHFTYHRDDSARVAWRTVLRADPSHVSAIAGMDRLKGLR